MSTFNAHHVRTAAQLSRPEDVLVTYTPPPAESWWVGLSPAAFYRRVTEEASRIRGSRFASMQTGPTLDEAAKWSAEFYRRGARRQEAA